MKKIILLVNLLLIITTCYGQRLSKPKRIRANGTYAHATAAVFFPESINNYVRTDISAFDKQQTNICAEYEYVNNIGKTRISIYVFPAGYGSRERLRNQFLYSLKSAAMVANQELRPVSSYCYYPKEGYKLNGFKAFFSDGNNNTLEVYECGSWFFKVRITSNLLYPSEMDRLNKQLVELFNPISLVKSAPLNPGANIDITRDLVDKKDSLLIGITLASALSEVLWVQKNVDSLERMSSYPGHYLDMYVDELKEGLVFADSNKNMQTTKATKQYIEQLKLLIDNNYLDEYLAEQYGTFLVVPEDKPLDNKSYALWKSSHAINIKLHDVYYGVTAEPTFNPKL